MCDCRLASPRPPSPPCTNRDGIPFSPSAPCSFERQSQAITEAFARAPLAPRHKRWDSRLQQPWATQTLLRGVVWSQTREALASSTQFGASGTPGGESFLPVTISAASGRSRPRCGFAPSEPRRPRRAAAQEASSPVLPLLARSSRSLQGAQEGERKLWRREMAPPCPGPASLQTDCQDSAAESCGLSGSISP